MISCIEIALKPELLDAEANGLKKKALEYFNIDIQDGRTVNLITIDADLSEAELELVKNQIFTNPVIQISSLVLPPSTSPASFPADTASRALDTASHAPLNIYFDWCIWVGFRPGVRDNAASTAMEAIHDLLKRDFAENEGVYTSKRYCIKGAALTRGDVEKIAGELLANPIIQQWKIFSKDEWKTEQHKVLAIPKVDLDHEPSFQIINIESDEALEKVSHERNLALNARDIPVIREYFLDESVRSSRKSAVEQSVAGTTSLVEGPTDVEIEYISQSRSDHCNHNTFRGIFRYHDPSTGENVIEDNLFKTYIQEPTLKLKEEKDWVVSVLWDNAGVGSFDSDHNYVITGETHNSPSNMEAYGGAITGIVGVYRDPMGTGLGSKLIMGSYGFCVGPIDYHGPLKATLHPRRLLDGVVEGVKDGGNKSGVPTTFGQTLFDEGYMGKSLVFVTALGIMPKKIGQRPSHEKKTEPGDLIVMSGGRVGKDGIHGVTASSEVLSENTPAGHVQIGDPYTQKKMHDFLLIARDEGLFDFITDNGGGGLSSSVGESAMISNGCEVWLDRVPLKYEGLDMWEIWVSESQERMTIAVKPEKIERFLELSKEHEVESTVIGKYTDTGKLHIKYHDRTCAWVDMDLLDKGFPKWEFDAVWIAPAQRGLTEPVLKEPHDYNSLICDMLSRPNICSKEWITRQYDHEVQGTSVIKPLVGINRDIPSDASVIRPVLDSVKGLAFSQAILPWYSKIDAFHMMTCTIDEAVRRIIAVGGSLSHIGGVDNFCWPDIQYHPAKNPDGKFKAAQLVRACRALKDSCFAYGIPLLSGKDSMYVDGYLQGKYGESIKVSALATVQFSVAGVVEDSTKCVTLDPKLPGDLIYVLGTTSDELGASEYYELLGKTGLNVPQVCFDRFKVIYRALEKAIASGIVASAHAIGRGGLATHLALSAISCGLGIEVDLSKVPYGFVKSDCATPGNAEGASPDKNSGEIKNRVLLFSESAGRFIVTIAPENKTLFEKLFSAMACRCIGSVTEDHCNLVIKGVYNEQDAWHHGHDTSSHCQDTIGHCQDSRSTGQYKNSRIIADISIESLESSWKSPMGGLI
ncbi:MAG: phosphoribosylformylglycinamidine synthase subunit PurS [Desulfamplus sp.]|nr:phosphoribosylformylglycinamidine synthase subunit PurS [Desulfamplus sp.]